MARTGTAETTFLRVNVDSLPNAFRVADDVYCGGSPVGDAGFAALADIGVATVISVDGQTPDVAAAERHGLAYVHLPHGYDAVPQHRILELAKALSELPGPIYVHCHYGKHRSPAATAVSCVATGRLDHDSAKMLLTLAGTGEEYQGLHRSVSEANRVETKTLQSLSVTFMPIAPIAELAASMTEVNNLLDTLKAVGGNDPHCTVLLREHFTEMLRMPGSSSRGDAFTAAMKHSRHLSQQLERFTKQPATEIEIASALQRIEADCKACHQSHRDR